VGAAAYAWREEQAVTGWQPPLHCPPLQPPLFWLQRVFGMLLKELLLMAVLLLLLRNNWSQLLL
jgi:hypothetical protein